VKSAFIYHCSTVGIGEVAGPSSGVQHGNDTAERHTHFGGASHKELDTPRKVFCSANLGDKVVYCTTDPRLRGPGTDHVPILMVLELPVERVISDPAHNFREVEWDDFRAELTVRLADIQSPDPIQYIERYTLAEGKLTRVIQDTIYMVVPQMQPSPTQRGGGVRSCQPLKGERIS